MNAQTFGAYPPSAFDPLRKRRGSGALEERKRGSLASLEATPDK